MTTTQPAGIMNWHRTNRENPYVTVGVSVAGVTDAAEALKLGGLDYTVHLDEMTSTHLSDHADTFGVQTVKVPRHFAVNARSNSTGAVRNLAVVGSKYVPIQNAETASALQHIVDSMHGEFQAIGHTHNGARTFVQLALPENATKIGGRDGMNWSLLALNSHDGSSKYTIRPIAVRIACENQLAGLRKGDVFVSFAHKKGSTSNVDLDALRASLTLSVKHIENFNGLANKLIDTPMTADEFDGFVKQVVPARKDANGEMVKYVITAREAMSTLFASSATMDGIRGTRWAAYNAVTEFDQWTKSRANAERIVTGRSDEFARAALGLLV